MNNYLVFVFYKVGWFFGLDILRDVVVFMWSLFCLIEK